MSGKEGPRQIIQQTDEDVLYMWRSEVEKAIKVSFSFYFPPWLLTLFKTATDMAAIRFFSEDLEETAQQCDRAILCIDGINRYSK